MFRIACKQVSAIRGYGTKSVFVGNVSKKTKPEQIKELFTKYGTVTAVSLPSRRGYAFVRMESAEAEKAISNLNGHTLNERALVIEMCKN
ncbi:hypothetical protein K7432_008731 [Basidiobolus ranarum]|uniref:RRM domain-containing protein n=1 Tax=Basidiobolus ranarum TaxID=34480 RepID=A0ABR2WRD9_9FUNG